LSAIFGERGHVTRTYHRLLKITSLEHVATIITDWLSFESLLDNELLREMRTIHGFFSVIMESDDSLSDHIQCCIDADIQDHLCDALCLQIDSGDKETTSIALGVGAAILLYVFIPINEVILRSTFNGFAGSASVPVVIEHLSYTLDFFQTLHSLE